ncbi:MAG TPA: DUF6600 domain-containing protein [Pyrinomonadaceae bacterium]|nr:DUF6600 domain-containing protein [Pyrinomonadaceae bacterium]
MRSRHTTPLVSLLLLLLTVLLLAAPPASAVEAEDDYPDEYDEQARVVRVSLMRGEVSLKRADNLEWEAARLNLPLVEGDTLATGRESRLEIQIDARNFVRLGADSVLRVVTLRDEGIALSLSEGTATLRLASFDAAREYFEIDAPKTTIAAEKGGLYRLDVRADGSVRVTVRDDGRARIYSETSGFTLRDGRTARLVYDNYADGDWELSSAPSFDLWDTWNDERERYLAVRLRYEDRERYYDRDVWGAEELDAYGDWSYTKEYGYVWRPHITVINQYHNWAPYRYGHWRWCPPYGWTWVADEDWGWAPYHYGRWVYYNNNWCWAPRGYGYNYRRAYWRPALVAFVSISTSFGEQVCWYPLQHGQRDPRGRHHARYNRRLSPLRADRIADLERTHPALLRAVTSVPAREFGTDAIRARPASVELARRTVTTEPLRGRLPIVPAETRRVSPAVTNGRTAEFEGRVNGTPRSDAGNEGRGSLRAARPASVRPPRSVPERATGAAVRTPGVALDGELRRARIFNNRDRRLPSSTVNDRQRGGDAPAVESNTGVVSRPSPVEMRPPSRRDRRDGSDGGAQPSPRERPTFERVRPTTRGDADMDDNTPGQRTRSARPREEQQQPAAPRVEERPAPREPEYRRQPSPRREIPSPERHEREAPRKEQPARVEPPARREEPPPQREEPRRQEQPRQEQSPRREESAPRQREERAAPPRSEPRERPARPKRDDQPR